MITAYCAAPSGIEKMDFKKVGSGTGIMRYAFGMYAGELETAKHYLESYKEYSGAERSFRIGPDKTTHITPNSLAYEITAGIVDSSYDYESMREKYKDDESALGAIDYLEKVGDVTVDYGVMHKIKIPGENIDDVKKWDDVLEPDELDIIAMAFYETQPDIISRAEKVLSKLDSDLIFEGVEDTLNSIWSTAYEEGVEDESIPFSVDEDDLKEVWNAKVRNDNSSTFRFEDEFDKGINSKYLKAARKIIGDAIIIENEMTIGGAYIALTNGYDPDIADVDKSIKGKRMASELFSGKEINIPMVVAETIFGNEDAYELIILSEELAEATRITPLDPFDFINEPKDECSLTKLRLCGLNQDTEDNDMSYDNRPSW